MNILADFHFLRPGWFLALVPILLLLGLIRHRQEGARVWRGLIADHLLPHLLSNQTPARGVGVIPLLAAGWLITVVALAGPTWKLEPSPFAEDTAALAIVIKVTPSMTVEDLQPSRLVRAVQKVQDLLALRPGAKTALIAYAGSAHRVMPLTTDAGIINTFAGALDPKIMPKDGDAAAAAFQIADRALAENGAGGSILWIADSLAPEEKAALVKWRQSSATPVEVLAPLPAGAELNALEAVASSLDAKVIRLTADDGDVRDLARSAKYATASGSDPGSIWQESGYLLTPFIALLVLPFFRRGWLVPTSAVS